MTPASIDLIIGAVFVFIWGATTLLMRHKEPTLTRTYIRYVAAWFLAFGTAAIVPVLFRSATAIAESKDYDGVGIFTSLYLCCLLMVAYAAIEFVRRLFDLGRAIRARRCNTPPT